MYDYGNYVSLNCIRAREKNLVFEYRYVESFLACSVIYTVIILNIIVVNLGVE